MPYTCNNCNHVSNSRTARDSHYKLRHQSNCKVTFANGKQSFRGLTLLAFIGQNGGTSKTYSFSVGDVIRMESEEQNGNGFICRCGKAFNGVRSIQKHGKRCKFIPTLPNQDDAVTREDYVCMIYY
jgi:hypothetical protein